MRHSLVHRAAAGALLAATGLALAGCGSLTATALDNTVGVTQLNVGGCAGPAPAPKPGSINCTGSVVLFVSMTVNSGWVSVRMAYPDSSSIYTGEVQVNSTHPRDMIVNIANPYQPACVTSYDTKINVYDGRLSDANARLLKSVSAKVRAFC